MSEVLGYGAWGEVQKVTRGGKILACKHVQYMDDIPAEILREIGFLRRMLSNEHMVQLIDAEFCPDGINIYLELMDGGNLNEFLTDYQRTPDKLDLKTISSFSKQILQGLDYIHSEKFLHRDLKPENILLCDNFSRLKICDFGLVRESFGTEEALTPTVYTDWYRPPELQLDVFTKYGKSADLWACGCVLLELVHRTPFFRPPGPEDTALSPRASLLYIWSKFNYTQNDPEMFVQHHHLIPRENLGVQFALGDGRFFLFPIAVQLLLDSKPSLRLPCSEALRILGEGV